MKIAFGKRIKDSIQEIIIVIIGITIAFQLENWSSSNKQQKEKAFFVQGMIDNLESDSISLVRNLKSITNKRNEINAGVKQIEEQTFDASSFQEFHTAVNTSSTFDISTEFYDAMAQSGLLHLFKNKNAVIGIMNYHKRDQHSKIYEEAEDQRLLDFNVLLHYEFDFDQLNKEQTIYSRSMILNLLYLENTLRLKADSFNDILESNRKVIALLREELD